MGKAILTMTAPQAPPGAWRARIPEKRFKDREKHRIRRLTLRICGEPRFLRIIGNHRE
jgi:hypothetical protein